MNIVFDVGRVIVEWEVEKVLSSVQADPQVKALMHDEMFAHNDWLLMDRGALDFVSLANRVAERTGVDLPTIEKFQYAAMHSLDYLPHSVELVKQLKGDNAELYVLSNMSKDVRHYLQSRDDFFDTHFKGLLWSHEHDCIKPEPEIFETFLEMFGLKAETCFFIDDRPENIEMAKEKGFETHLFQNPIECVNLLKSKLVRA
jgi:putative hydrolase of the HAD superfamily